MGYPEGTIILFSVGDPVNPGGGSIRDQAVHESQVVEINPKHSLLKATIPLENELDKPVEVKLLGRTEDVARPWQMLETKALAARIGAGNPTLDVITLTDNWRALKLTVQVTGGADSTAGDFDSQYMPVMEE